VKVDARVVTDGSDLEEIRDVLLGTVTRGDFEGRR
jgi:hypothetical protein